MLQWILTANMDLPRTFLKGFELSGELLAVHENRLYTVQSTNGQVPSSAFFSFLGRKYGLEKCESLARLESLYIDKHRSQIKQYLDSFIEINYVSKLERSEQELFKKKDFLERNRESVVERFIREQIVAQYQELAKNYFQDHSVKAPPTVNRSEQVKINTLNREAFKFPGVDDLKTGRSCLEQLLGESSLLVVRGQCYRLVETQLSNLQETSPRNASPEKSLEYVQFGSKHFCLTSNFSVEQLENDYRTALGKKISSEAKRQGEIIIPQIKANEKKIKELEKLAAQSQDNDFGSLKCENLGNNLFRIYLHFPSYLIKKENRYFKFKEVKVGTDLEVSDNHLAINAPPRVLDGASYSHPFVSSNNSICYHGGDRWELIPVTFGVRYSLNNQSDYESVGRKVALTLGEGWKIIHHGYHGLKLKDSHNLIGKSERELTRNEALSSGLRVHDND